MTTVTIPENFVYIDMETVSPVNLKDAGGFKYATHKETDVLCIAYAHGIRPIEVWTPTESTYMEIKPDYKVLAWNASFERYIWKHILVPRYGFKPVADDQWIDVAAVSAYFGGPLGLDKAAAYWYGTSLKDPAGTRLIKKLCCVLPGMGKLSWRGHEKEYMALYNYCKRDVEAMMTIHGILEFAELPPTEQEIWVQTTRMNERGVPVDKDEIKAICKNISFQRSKLEAMVPFITDGQVRRTRQVKKLKDYLNAEYDLHIDDLQKETIKKLLTVPELPTKARKLLTIRQQTGLSTNAKYEKALKMVAKDGRIHDCFAYYGAHTGRLAGRGIQLQNLKRVKFKEQEVDQLFTFIKVADDPELVAMVYGYKLLEILSKYIRGIIKAPIGKKFINADYSSIEAIATPWMAGEWDIVNKMAKGLDLYKDTAAKMFSMKYEEVDSEVRQIGKICVLACGYAGGTAALMGMAQNYGLNLEEYEAAQHVKAFRQARRKLVNTWYAFENAAIAAIGAPYRKVRVDGCPPGVHFTYHKNRFQTSVLEMQLPSDRSLYYPHIEYVLTPKTHFGAAKGVIYYQSAHYGTKKMITGANLFQHSVQAVCRDLLMLAQLRLEEYGYPIILSVHDECMAEVNSTGDKNLEEFVEYMTLKPAWAASLPIKAEGWEGRRYRK